jgi:tetratricopeptide (TPR) repeat protein
LIPEDRQLTMNRFVPYLLQKAKTLILGVCLAVLPWLGLIYICGNATPPRPKASADTSRHLVGARSSPPNLFPSDDPDHCLPISSIQSEPIKSVGFPTQQSAEGNLDAGPILTGPAQIEKSQSAHILPSGIIDEDHFDESSAGWSPRVWEPKELDIAKEMPESVLEKTILSDSVISMQTPSAAQTTANDKQPEAATETTTEQEYIYPSTEPLLARRAIESILAKESLLANQTIEPVMPQKATETKIPVRSELLESIARQADQQIRHGYELAGRGAYYAARSEFIAALRLVAQGLDTEGKAKTHGKSLAAALTALKEADDFMPSGSQLEADLNLPDIIKNHVTPVLKDADKDTLTSLTATKKYLTYSQEQFAQAIGGEVAGSMALRAMGKLHEEFANSKNTGVKAPGPKAIVFYQSSLLVSPQNFMAANDLGVMLARNGNYKDACKILEHGCSLTRQSNIWRNLAWVQERLGNDGRACQARQLATAASQQEQITQQKKLDGGNDQVRWVDESSFTNNVNPSGMSRRVPPASLMPGGPIAQQARPVAPQTQSIMQPSTNQYRSASVNAVQTAPPAGAPLPALRPAANNWTPNATYEIRR